MSSSETPPKKEENFAREPTKTRHAPHQTTGQAERKMQDLRRYSLAAITFSASVRAQASAFKITSKSSEGITS